MDTWDWILSLLATGGIIVVTVYAPRVLKFYVQNWIKSQSDKDLERVRSQFSKDLEQVRSQFSKDLEQVKSELSVHTRRRMTWQDKEYEVFPEIWTRLCDAHDALDAATALSVHGPDFNHMGDDEFMHWLEEQTDWHQVEKAEIKNAKDRVSVFARTTLIKKSRIAAKSHNEFRTYTLKNIIFLRRDIKVKMEEVTDMLKKSLDENHAGLKAGGNPYSIPSRKKAREIFSKDVVPRMKKIERIVQDELDPESAKP